MPGPGDFGSWSSERCVPLAATPGSLGEPCEVSGPYDSGIDDCDEGLLCWTLGEPGESIGRGICYEICDLSEPVCTDPFSTCTVPVDTPLDLCMPICNPNEPECPQDQVCIFHLYRPVPATCGKDLSGDGGELLSPCQSSYDCDPGLACFGSGEMACGADTFCCQQLCSVSAQDCTSGPCSPLYGPDTAVFGLEDVGICAG